MSYFDSPPPVCRALSSEVELTIHALRKSLGEFGVARALPAPERTLVGPFIFFDHMGPADFEPGHGIEVRPHPHIGISAITYLFEGLIVHRDSLGFEQPIEAGAVNLMVAGRGIVHSERAGRDLGVRSRLHGIQSWLALPDAELEREPAFTHYPAAAIPAFERDGVQLRLIIGEAFGRRSPVRSFVPTLYLEIRMPAGSRIVIPASVPELAIYGVSGSSSVGTQAIDSGVMVVMRSGARLELSARSDAHLMVLGGAPVGHRELEWNFVAPSRERIEQAGLDWKAGRFGRIAGDDEFIPLPE